MERQLVRNLQFKGNAVILISLTIFFYLPYSYVHGQDWESVGSGFDREVKCLYADTLDNVLYCGGSFKMSGSKEVRGISKWNGVYWDSLQAGIDDFNTSFPNPVNTIIRFQNNIMVGGAFSTAGNIQSPYLARWNGFHWDSLICFPNKSITNFEILDTSLYVMSAITSICGQSCGLVAKFDGTNWIGINLDTDTSFGNVSSLSNFMGNLFVAGNLLPIRDIFMWNGSQSIQLGQGIFGAGSYITSIEVYQNELYVAGKFSTVDGNVGENIIKWDGTNWSEVGGGLNHQVEKLKVYGGYLYAVGIFNHAGGIPASCIARWDGNSWFSLSNQTFDNGIGCIEFYNGELYVGGGFMHIDTLSVNRIAKFTGSLSIVNSTKSSFNINLIPNPFYSDITIKFSSAFFDRAKLIISDITGREFMADFISTQSLSTRLNLSQLPSGVYFLSLLTAHEKVTKKIIKL